MLLDKAHGVTYINHTIYIFHLSDSVQYNQQVSYGKTYPAAVQKDLM